MKTRLSSAAERPLLYDLAYDVFDVAEECEKLLALARRHGLGRPRRVLDLGCGTGHHARHFSALGLSVVAVDSDAHMLRRAKMLAREAATEVAFHNADMRHVRIDGPADLAVCLGASFNSLVSQDDASSFLRSAGAALRPSGVLIVELHEPRVTYGADRTARWTVERPAGRVHGRFSMTPRASGIFRWDIVVDADMGGKRRRALFRNDARPWTRRDLHCAARAAGTVRLVGWHRLANPGESPRVLAVLTRERAGRS